MNRSPPRVALGTSRPPGASSCTGLCAVQVTWPPQQMLCSLPLTGDIPDVFWRPYIDQAQHAESPEAPCGVTHV